MSSCRPGFGFTSLLRLAAVLWLAGCLAGPETTTATPRPPGSSAGSGRVISLRAALPDTASGRVDSAEVRVTGPGADLRAPMSVGDSALEAELRLEAAEAAKVEVYAFSKGALAYYGSSVLEPDSAGGSAIRVSLGPVGRVRLDAGFAPAMD